MILLKTWLSVTSRGASSNLQTSVSLRICRSSIILRVTVRKSKVSLPFITIGDSQITPSSQARNLGVIFDSTMTLKPHISNIVRVSSFHIRNISRIRKYLNQSAAEQIIHAFVKSRLDNGNALFYGLPQNQISRLQHIQNTAARVVTLSRKSSHITPILKELHWLPVSQRIVFKLMLIVHKSVNNIAPIYISELLKVYTPSRNLCSSNIVCLFILSLFWISLSIQSTGLPRGPD